MHGRRTAFLYGYPPTKSIAPEPVFQAYLKAEPDPDEAQKLREALLEIGPFVGGGKYTLTMAVRKENIQAAQNALQFMFDWEEKQRN